MIYTQKTEYTKFTSEELTKEEVVTLLKAGLMTSSSKGQPNCWNLYLTIKKYWNSFLTVKGSDFVKDAALALVVVADPLHQRCVD